MIHNFDTIIEKMGFGYEITSLVVAKQKIQGQYNHTGPVEIFHDWLAERYPAPDTVVAIDDRLGEIISESEFVVFASNMADAFNTLARHGNVPDSLFENNTKYWSIVSNLSACQYNEECDANAIQEILDTKVYENDPGPPPKAASNWLSLVLPSAYAWIETYHSTRMHGEPHTCTYGTCKVGAEFPWSVGEHSTTLSPPVGERELGHGTSREMDVFVSTCAHMNSYSYVSAVVRTGDPTSTHIDTNGSGTGCAIIKITVLAHDRPIPSYVWYIQGSSNAWTR